MTTPPAGRLHAAATKLHLPALADAYSHPDVIAVEAAARDAMAQIKLTEMRRKQCPGLTTWSPFDQTEPDQLGAGVWDGDADIWTRNSRSGRWRMTTFNASRHETRAGKALTWQQLAYHYGPLTIVPPPALAVADAILGEEATS